MSVTRRTVRDKTYQLERSIKGIGNKKIVVGCLDGGENAYIASIQEYGVRIEITPKMRAWLHYNGLHVKKETKYIEIPERAFLRNGYDINIETITKKSSELMNEVIDGEMSAETFLAAIGTELRDAIKRYAIELKTPANHPFTIKRKGSSNPLVDTGQMIESIKYEVEEE